MQSNHKSVLRNTNNNNSNTSTSINQNSTYHIRTTTCNSYDFPSKQNTSYSNHSNQNHYHHSPRMRRRKPTNHTVATTKHRRFVLKDIHDVHNVPLEQVVRELQYYEAFHLSEGSHIRLNTNHATYCSTSHRTFAIEYIENILLQWSQEVQLSQQQTQRTIKNCQIGYDSHRSFASVVASGSKHEIQPAAAFTTSEIDSKSSCQINNTNAWSKPLMNLDVTKSVAPVIIPFGSYRLGVHSTSSDLDLLTIVPPFISRNDFFTSFVKLLQNDPRCHRVHPIPTAYTPVIKFSIQCGPTNTDDEEFNSNLIPIDLVFASISDPSKLIQYHKSRASCTKQQVGCTVSTNKGSMTPQYYYIIDDSDLQNMDEIGVRSLNGARVSQMILQAVEHNVTTFQIVLCAVKHWALVHGLYSNVLGLLGGINWAILVAWVCKRYPDANADKTLQLFFRTFANWKWNNPVLLFDEIADIPPICNISLQSRAVTLPAWNPATNPRDGLHLMPIITPAYPSMNSSYNVDYPQLRSIQSEMIRTCNLLNGGRSMSNYRNNATSNICLYRTLFRSSDFFQRHKNYIQINIRCCSDCTDDFVKWFRYVESKIRNLISSLETPDIHAWPFARFFHVPQINPSYDKSSCLIPSGGTYTKKKMIDEKCFFIGLRFTSPGISTSEISPLTMEFLHKVNSWSDRTSDMDVSISHITNDDIPLHVMNEMKQTKYTNDPPKSITHKIDGSENTYPATDDEDETIICL